jgi:cytosine/adenosine deaminase-related metal-dependent hydrolase
MRKYQADRIFDGYGFLGRDAVLITQDDGTVMEIIDRKDAGDNIERHAGILSPGFINCHCHLELSHMKGLIPRETGLVQFVTDVVSKRHFPEEQILDSIAGAENEMLQNGIVAVGDICNNTLTIPQKQKSNLHYHNFIEASGYHPSVVSARFERAVSILKEYQKHFPSSQCSLAPHAPYSVADELWTLLIGYPGNNLFTVHNQETEGENEWFESGSGPFVQLYENLKIETAFFSAPKKSSLQNYLGKFRENQTLILVHNVHTSEPDINYAKSGDVKCSLYWCLCPNANEYISGQTPPVIKLMQNDCTIVLGTDSLASNDHLSIWDEIKTIQNKFPSIEPGELLKWATSNGAKALNLDWAGSLEKNKKPGLILITEKIKRLV